MNTVEAPPFTEEDIAILLDALGKDDLQCEAKHGKRNWSEVCSIEVTHRVRITCSGITLNLCLNEAKFTEECFATDIECRKCTRPLADCWRLNPI